MRLILFDVDGTLVQSTGIDSLCYAQAVSERLETPINTNWTDYRESTDTGILNELLDRHGIPPNRHMGIYHDVKQRFIGLLTDALHSDPACCRQVAGAGQLIKCMQEAPDLRIGIATGGWSTSAKLKLHHAGISTKDIPFASSDDADSREEILRLARQRSAADGAKFDRITYVGDGVWDVKAAAALGFQFVGMACESGHELLSASGAKMVLDHFLDQKGFLRHSLAD